MRKSPGWVNARYRRTLEWLAQGDFTERDYVLIWLFSILDNQVTFAFDLAIKYERVFGRDDTSQLIKDECILRVKKFGRRLLVLVKSLVPDRIKRSIKKIVI